MQTLVLCQQLQMPMGREMSEDVEEPMPACLATLRDPGTPDQIVMEQHSLTHFPSQPWCKICVESRGRDSPHREQPEIDAVVPQLQFVDYRYMGDGGPLQIACFFVGADTSSGAIHATMVPDSKKMDMPCVVAAEALAMVKRQTLGNLFGAFDSRVLFFSVFVGLLTSVSSVYCLLYVTVAYEKHAKSLALLYFTYTACPGFEPALF